MYVYMVLIIIIIIHINIITIITIITMIIKASGFPKLWICIVYHSIVYYIIV